MELPWRLFAGILVLWLLVGVVPFAVWANLHDAAEFASAFGFVNALFAALAFGGVIWAIRLQTKELELQRLEIEETRDELRRSADAQQQSQQMHFLAALLAARNNVAQGYAAAAQHETGSLRVSQLAHRQHLAELEWLLHLVDRQAANPFALPTREVIVAHQLDLLLRRTRPILEAALCHRAANHVRRLELNQSLRELRRLMASNRPDSCELSLALKGAIAQGETVSTMNEFEEIEAACLRVMAQLAAHLTSGQ